MKKNRSIKGLITGLMVIIGICGIGWFTLHLGKMFVGLVSAGSFAEPLTQVQTTDSQILNLPAIALWTCQVGVYKDQKNAEIQIETLRQRGWKAAIITDGPYTVAIGSFPNKDEAALCKDRLAEDGIESWLKQENFPALHYKVKGNHTEEVIRILSLSNSLLNGTARDTIRKELEAEPAFTGGCPADFTKLNETLMQILTKDYSGNDADHAYYQDVLHLYVQYKEVTTQYFANPE